MKVLADFHHEDLYESLRLLFEVRLGWELYRPIGMPWYHEDYWLVFPSENTAHQYLSCMRDVVDPQGNPTAHGRYAEVNRKPVGLGEGVYNLRGRTGQTYRGIELWAAKEAKFDVILSSIPAHWHRYERFRKQYCPAAKHIFQMGNVGWKPPVEVQNLLNSTSYVPESDMHYVDYHQEFSLEDYYPSPCTRPKSLTNLMHLQHGHLYEKFKTLRWELEQEGWIVHDYGAGNADGPVNEPTTSRVIRKAGFIWHCKQGGDGYGYNIHHTFAIGRPMVIKGSECRGQIAARLFEPGRTVIDLDSHTEVSDLVQTLEMAANNHTKWCERVREQFKKVVNFDREFEEIKHFMERLR